MAASGRMGTFGEASAGRPGTEAGVADEARATPRPVSWDGGLLDDVISRLVSARARAGETELAARYTTDRDSVYEVTGERRARDLDRLHVRLADHLGLVGALRAILAETPASWEGIGRIVVVPPPPGEEEALDIRRLRGDASPALVVALRPDRWLALAGVAGEASREAAVALVHHELVHCEDVLAPEFGRPPTGERSWPGQTRAAQDRTRRRFSALWCASVQARLVARGRAGPASMEARRGEILAVFGAAAMPGIDPWLERWSTGERPVHATLLELAGASTPVRREASGRGAEVFAPPPAGPCVLCGFATVDWFDPARLPEAARGAMRRDAPGWNPAEAVCRRCVEAYVIGTVGFAALIEVQREECPRSDSGVS